MHGPAVFCPGVVPLTAPPISVEVRQARRLRLHRRGCAPLPPGGSAAMLHCSRFSSTAGARGHVLYAIETPESPPSAPRTGHRGQRQSVHSWVDRHGGGDSAQERIGIRARRCSRPATSRRPLLCSRWARQVGRLTAMAETRAPAS